jgi:integrase
MRAVTEHHSKDGRVTYRVRYRLGSRQTSETFRQKRDAHTFAALLDNGGITDALAWLQGKESRKTDVTLAEWHEHYVNHLTGITSRTRDDYRALRRRYLTDLDPLPLPLITRSHVAALVNQLDREGRSPKTIRNVVHMLSSCMALAVYEGLITRNPCHRVRLPSARVDAIEARFLTFEEFHALYQALPAHYRPLVVFLVGTGLRWSEATALQGRHVNLAAGTVRVDRAWKRIPGGFEIGPPKTEKSKRTINAAVQALAAVEEVRRGPNDLLFTTPAGGTIAHSNFYNRIWKPACKAAGLNPPPRIHDLRHTHASWLISDGQSLEAVQDQLGHNSILTTRGVYGHLLPALGVALGKSASESLSHALSDRLQATGGRRLALTAAGPDHSAHPDHVGPDVQDASDR